VQGSALPKEVRNPGGFRIQLSSPVAPLRGERQAPDSGKRRTQANPLQF